ncbi:MAG: T9SS type A sorting domain-containing protein [Bacteroidales bacterium]|nr:T9SS type A sorting domain-containing protein [Bacteroidales bacterium]
MKRNIFTRVLKSLFILLFVLGIGEVGWGQTAITALSTAVTQNFDGLASSGASNAWSNNTTLSGWYAKTTGVASFSAYGVSDGSTFISGLYSFGTGSNSDRALGYSGATYTGTYYLGWRLRNNTGTVIKSFTVVFDGEQWRNNVAGQQTIKLSYKVDEINLTATGYANTLTNFFTAPYIPATATSLDGNNVAYRALVTNSVSFPVNIEPGQEVMLRWEDLRVANKDVMAIDNVSVTAEGLPAMPVALAPSNVTASRFTLNWIPGRYATGYYVNVFDDQANYLLEDYFVNGALTSSLALPVDATSATTYYYTVQSYNSGSSTYSAFASNQITTYTESTEPDYIFQGDNGSDWSDDLSWSSDAIPTVYNSAIIDATCYVDVLDATCNNLTINASKTLNINPGQILTVNGEISETSGTVNSLKILSNSLALDGTGILMHGNSGVKGTIERFVSGTSNGGGELYHLVSVPINTAASPLYSDVFLWSYLARYDESANNWYQMNTPTDNSIISGRGYMTYDPTDATETYLFPGQFNNSTTDMTVSFAGSGWNLVGNPYPSPIDWDAANAWNKTNVDNTLYLWDATNHQYITYVNGVASDGRTNPGIISPGQAFFVRANAASPVLSVNNLARTISTVPLFKGALANSDLLRLTANIDEKLDAIVVRLTPEASDEFDRNFDAYNLTSMAGTAVPDIYTVDANSTKYSINAVPYSGEEKIFDLAFKYGTDGLVTLTASEIESFNTQHPDIDIQLEDKQLGTTTSLKQNPVYSFSYSVSDDPMRFRIHMGNTLLGLNKDIVAANKCRVYNVNKELYLKYADFQNQQGSAFISDIQGRLIKTIPLDKSGDQQVIINVKPGIYMVKLMFDGYVQTQKIAIR